MKVKTKNIIWAVLLIFAIIAMSIALSHTYYENKKMQKIQDKIEKQKIIDAKNLERKKNR